MNKLMSWVSTLMLSFFIAVPLASCAQSNNDLNYLIESDNGVKVEGEFEKGVVLEANVVTSTEKEVALNLIANEKYDKEGEIYVFELTLLKDGSEIQPNGNVRVSISIPTIDTNKTYTVYHIGDNSTVDKIKPIVEIGKVTFETSAFSCFIVAPDAEEGGDGEKEEPKVPVQVSITILPLASYGMLKVNDVLYEAAASYKEEHYEGDLIKVEAIPSKGHHFMYWGEDSAISENSVYEFTVGKKQISFAANFSDGHVVAYSQITEDTHYERCKYCDYAATVKHVFTDEKVITEATCQHEGLVEFYCVCGKTHSETTSIADHNFIDGTCLNCGKAQTYIRCNAAGVEDPNGAYIRMGTTYCEQVRDRTGVIPNKLVEISGAPNIGELEKWTAFDFGNGDNSSTYYCDVTLDGLNYRGIYFENYRADNDSMQTTNRYWDGLYWFEAREAMWSIVSIKDGKAYCTSKNIWISQRFAESDTGDLTYQNSWVRNWLLTNYIDELFTEAQKEILNENVNCFNDKIFVPSLDEISISDNKAFGLYEYPVCLGAFKDSQQGYGDNYCPYWLRDGIVKGDDDLNYVECINSHAPFNETVRYLANKTFVAVVPGIIVTL